MKDKQEFHIPITSNDKTAIDWLAEVSGISRQKLKKHMHKGCVWLERPKSSSNENGQITDILENNTQGFVQRLRRAKKVLSKNQKLHFYYDESVLFNEPTPAILIEDLGDYSVWNKPCGMLSQGSKWGDHSTIYRWAETQLQPERPAFTVHRLDRAANGLIILAHKKSVASQFSSMFEKRQIDKKYRVEVEGDFSMLTAKSEGRLTIDNFLENKTAISHVSMLAFNEEGNTSTLDVNIETGRKHQIRKHLAEIGFPVVGDRLYSDKGNSGADDLQLQAKSLKFICPVSGDEKNFTLGS